MTRSGGRSSGSAPSWSNSSTSALPQSCSSVGVYSAARPPAGPPRPPSRRGTAARPRRRQQPGDHLDMAQTRPPRREHLRRRRQPGGQHRPSNPVCGATCRATVTRRWASNRSQPSRSVSACGGGLVAAIGEHPSRSSPATVATVTWSSRRATDSHSVSSEIRSASPPTPPPRAARRPPARAGAARRRAGSRSRTHSREHHRQNRASAAPRPRFFSARRRTRKTNNVRLRLNYGGWRPSVTTEPARGLASIFRNGRTVIFGSDLMISVEGRLGLGQGWSPALRVGRCSRSWSSGREVRVQGTASAVRRACAVVIVSAQGQSGSMCRTRRRAVRTMRPATARIRSRSRLGS